MITGYVCALITIILLLKVVGRKSGKQSLNLVLRKIHKPLGLFMVAIILVHLLLTLPVWGQRSTWVIASGFVTALAAVFMILTFTLRKRWKKIWFRFHRIGACLIGLFLVIHISTYFIGFASYQRKIENISIEGVSAQDVADGTYIGEYDAGYIHAKVEVTVVNKRIENIKLLKHENERGAKAEVLIPEMVKEQTTQVDTISGATKSSLVIQKAVENALNGH